MQCNIDRRGKTARLITGLLCLLAGGVMVVLGWLNIGPYWPMMGMGWGCLAGGAFQVFEAWSGWCVIRSMGFKTPV